MAEPCHRFRSSSELTSELMGSLQRHHQSVLERRTLERQTAHNKPEQHCLELKKAVGSTNTDSEASRKQDIRRSNKSLDLEPQTDDFDLNINRKRTKNESRVPHWWFSIPPRRSQAPLSTLHISCAPEAACLDLTKAATLPTASARPRLQTQTAISQLCNWCIFEHKVCFCDTKSSTTPVIFKRGDKLRYLQGKYYERG